MAHVKTMSTKEKIPKVIAVITDHIIIRMIAVAIGN